MRCKTCNQRHLLVLHKLNDRSAKNVQASEASSATTDSGTARVGEKVLYIDTPLGGCKVLLKISKVLLRNGDLVLESYAVLDDGSERTILLSTAAEQLGLKGQPKELPLRTVRQNLHVLQGEAVSFSISPTSEPRLILKINQVFTAETLGLAEHTRPVNALK